MDPAVKKETGYIAFWVLLLSLIMEAVFLIIPGAWDLSVLFGNLGGGIAVTLNFFLLALLVSKALKKDKPEAAARQVKATATLRLLALGGICALLIGVAHTNPISTLVPLLFPRIGLLFRPMIDRKRGVTSAGTDGTTNENTETEGSDLID